MQEARKQQATRSVRAADLQEALQRVRLLYGPDALVLGTRRVLERAEGELAPRPMVEVRVSVPGAELPEREARTEDPLKDSMQQLDHLMHQVSELSREVQQQCEEDYVLAPMLRKGGASEASIAHLAASFARASAKGPQNYHAARRHLGHWLRGAAEPKLTAMGGEHWFLGRAGSGKTSMVLHLAASLLRVGRRPGLISLRPQHGGEWARIEAAAKALDLSAELANDEQELARARTALAAHDVTLIDTPCLRLCTNVAGADDSAIRHLVVPLGDDPRLVRGLIALPQLPAIDSLAISQSDLLARPGRILDLLRELARPISFIGGRDRQRIVVEPVRQEDLLQWILGEAAVRESS